MKLLDTLEQSVVDSQPSDDYDLKRKCVIIAGLCHDLGHGPFSHLWEHVIHTGGDNSWTHEDQSVRMLEFMLQDNHIELHEDPVRHKYALRLISSLIRGDCDEWRALLQPNEVYLTEIVSNKFCEIDMDKCDYILRDALYTEVKIDDFISFMDRAKVVVDKDSGETHIGYHEQDFHLVEKIFRNRAMLHDKVYQSEQVMICEKMVKDICDEASKGGVKIAGKPLCEVQLDDSAYLKLDDSVLEIIRECSLDNSHVVRAKEILSNLQNGKYYKKIWESHDDTKRFRDEIKSKFGDVLWQMKIPKSQIPKNIQFYTNNDDLVPMESELDLSKEYWLILTDDKHESDIKMTLDGLNNNA